ncbi:MAG: hypothetical protein AAFY28_12625 [Actinomycetota bacterium]
MAEAEPGDQDRQAIHTAAPTRYGVLPVLGAASLVVGLGLLLYSLVAEDEGTAAVPVTGNANSLNMSCFAFRDINADGQFDTDDRPYAWLSVAGEGPGGSTRTQSNMNGFANFPMLLDGDNALVSQPGAYRFEALPPKSFMLTTGSVERVVEFAELEGSPVGIVAVDQCEPYGLTPALTISGSLELQNSTAEEVIIENGSEQVDADVADGRYAGDVVRGEWMVSLSDGDAAPMVRAVEVTDVPVVVSSSVNHDAPTQAAEVVLGFDDFTAANTIAEIPNGYGGLNWSNWVATHRLVYGGPGYVNTNTSGEFVAYNGSGSPGRVSSDEPFDFVGAYFGVAWPAAESHPVTVQAWRDDELVYEDSLELATTGAVYFDADYRDITALEVVSSARWQVVIDDAAFRVGG